ncbi:hypothetical protein LTS08_001837 [Lithohypha guttulata]|uniref:GTP-binding protein EsdC n=1 Tax=Lithohypha guttulata TaxID=1690604 RepID=A0AAN7YDN4_9EURO|nr:hypothetical protein LTR05_007126 [Lithohypha guttulata]KAK5105560.1 hypothetical protein LTS08_001837 [Lithohypha guttulata]
MSSPAVQLTFTLRTSPNVRTVHLLGSWDGYKSQLPLAVAKDPEAKPGSWKGTFRFQGAHALKLGSRYWYYYIVDGYHVSHDPAKEHVVEKTTGRKLNVLNVPAGGSKPKPAPASSTSKPELSKLDTQAPKTPTSTRVPQGRALSPGKILHPKPQKPYASRGLREADYDASPIDDLEERFAGTSLSDRHARYASSPSELSECSDSSGTVFSTTSGSASSATSGSDSEHANRCRCNRYGLTRAGQRVMLDCGGKRCGYADSDSSSCGASSDGDEAGDTSSSDESEEDEREAELRRRARARLEAERAKNAARGAPAQAQSRHAVSTKAAPQSERSARHAATTERRRR